MKPINNLKEISQSLQSTLKSKSKSGRKRNANPFLGTAFTRMIPNIATVLALCSGLSSMRFAYGDDFRMAVAAILLAAIFDLMDGRLARMLGASSEFGAELDSLSDFVSFGAAPALVLYMATLQHYGNWGWTACLFFAVCSGFRLARFNILTRTPVPKTKTKKADFFIGVPAPMAAIVSLLPLMIFFALEFKPTQWSPAIIFAAVVGSGVLMVSKIPTFSSKSLIIPPQWRTAVMLGSGITLASLYATPWITLSIFGLAYLGSIPMVWWSYRKVL